MPVLYLIRNRNDTKDMMNCVFARRKSKLQKHQSNGTPKGALGLLIIYVINEEKREQRCKAGERAELDGMT